MYISACWNDFEQTSKQVQAFPIRFQKHTPTPQPKTLNFKDENDHDSIISLIVMVIQLRGSQLFIFKVFEFYSVDLEIYTLNVESKVSNFSFRY